MAVTKDPEVPVVPTAEVTVAGLEAAILEPGSSFKECDEESGLPVDVIVVALPNSDPTDCGVTLSTGIAEDFDVIARVSSKFTEVPKPGTLEPNTAVELPKFTPVLFTVVGVDDDPEEKRLPVIQKGCFHTIVIFNDISNGGSECLAKIV